MSEINLGSEYSYKAYMYDVYNLSKIYDQVLKVSIIGKSFDNRDIPMIKLGKGNLNFICTAGVHGRETINTIVLMKIIETYCKAYYLQTQVYDYNIPNILNNTSIYFIPLLNPDGYMTALKGFNEISNYNYRKICNKLSSNSSVPYIEWKYNARGIDINRNFPCKSWRPKFKDDIYTSERETIALTNVFNTVPSNGYIDFHSRGNEIYYYRNAMSKEYNNIQLTLAKKLQVLTGYSLVNKVREIDIGDTGGNTVQYYSEFINQPAITIETVPNEAEFPLATHYQQKTYNEILAVPISFAKELSINN